MAITDLTNTSWTLNDTIDCSSSVTYNVNLTSNNDDFVYLIFSPYSTFPNELYYGSSQSGMQSVYESGTWINTAYKNITITGGSDATNSSLISWIEANATKYIEPHDIIISYNGNTITMDDSGTEVLDTKGHWLPDDITVEYTKPSGTDTVVDFIENHEVYSEYTNSLVTKISPYTFYSCKSLKTVDFQACSIIGSSAFAYCTSLTTISFPECTDVNAGAFYSCGSLSSASLSKCTIIRSSAFYSCKKLSTIYAPICSNIQTSAFYGAGLTSADFPSVSHTIGAQAFAACSSMATISFPECSSTAASAFLGCYKLKSVELRKCKYMAGNTFNNCSSLSVVSLPMMITMAGSSNFYRCYHLVSLYLLGSSVAKLSNSNTFTSTPIAGYTTSTGGVYGKIYVPSSLYSSYISATNWTYFSSRFVSV